MDELLNGLINNPYGRRHIIDLYQYKGLNESDGLYPCAFLTIWNVRNLNNEEYLDMCLIQRSGDMLTASGPGGINEIQYAALLMMIARHTGDLPGVFSHLVANEKIYDRHFENAAEMMNRFNSLEETAASPKLILNPEKTNFYDFTIDDFTMEDYTPIKPQLKFELGI